MVAAMQHRGPPSELGDANPKPPTPVSCVTRFGLQWSDRRPRAALSARKSARLRELQHFLYSL